MGSVHPHHSSQVHSVTRGGAGNTNYGSPQRRFLSEGELVRQGATPGDLAYSRTNNTVDNIRELAGSPQRGVYMWKDTSPGAYGSGGNGMAVPPHHHQPVASQHQRGSGYDYYRSNPTSPTQQQQQQPYGVRPPPTNYYPPVRGGVPVYPPPQSPQIKRKTVATPTTPTANVSVCDGRRPSPGSRRPMSFVRALEMSDSIEMTSASPGTPRTEHRLVTVGGTSGTAQDAHRSSTPTPDRASVYDMNYEISV